jgi:Fur family transcriptional regulator, peroxide stress response regulator
MQTHNEEHKLIDQLRKYGVRATGQRLAIMQALLDSRSHPSAEDIYQKVKHTHPTLSISTIYKTIQIMTKMGTVLTIETGTGGQRYDGHVEPHHHAICNKCGEVFDIDFQHYPIDLDKKNVMEGFDVQGIKVTFLGTCHTCETKKT